MERISVIIPALNEAEAIGRTLERVLRGRDVEAVVVDGGSDDGTAERACALGATVISGPRGRASQMNAGATLATGRLLIFLHADTLLPEGYDSCVRRILGDPNVAAGAFRLRIEGGGPGLRVIERVVDRRSRWLGVPYGDQALFMRSDRFRLVGGFPRQPILEDVALLRRLRSFGRVAIADVPVSTSPRRWQSLGLLHTTLINQVVMAGYFLGAHPAFLAALYRASRNTPSARVRGSASESD